MPKLIIIFQKLLSNMIRKYRYVPDFVVLFHIKKRHKKLYQNGYKNTDKKIIKLKNQKKTGTGFKFNYYYIMQISTYL